MAKAKSTAQNQKFTAKQMIDALTKAKGIKATAAKTLKCSRNTVDRYIRDFPTVATAFDEINEAQIDHVESALIKQIDDDNITAIIFYLKTKAKHRGYVERQEVTGKDGKPMEHSHSGKLHFENMSDDELDNLITD